MIYGLALTIIAASAGQEPPGRMPHPEIPCWTGMRTWTPPGERPSDTTTFDTQDEVQPYLITHNRDQIRTGSELTQDYNFIDYWFGEPAAPIRARYYFRNDGSVGVILPGSGQAPLSLARARELMPADVLCYLQRRFDRIEVLASGGYELLWAHRP